MMAASRLSLVQWRYRGELVTLARQSEGGAHSLPLRTLRRYLGSVRHATADNRTVNIDPLPTRPGCRALAAAGSASGCRNVPAPVSRCRLGRYRRRQVRSISVRSTGSPRPRQPRPRYAVAVRSNPHTGGKRLGAWRARERSTPSLDRKSAPAGVTSPASSPSMTNSRLASRSASPTLSRPAM